MYMCIGSLPRPLIYPFWPRRRFRAFCDGPARRMDIIYPGTGLFPCDEPKPRIASRMCVWILLDLGVFALLLAAFAIEYG